MRRSIGWKAIIYDAPWAYFKDGQPGVIVTEDGKTCETTNDDLSSIIIVADENTLFEERTGKVKFIQNESGKDIDIDLVQVASKHVYEIHVDDFELTDCKNNTTYNDFLHGISAYWIVDGERGSDITVMESDMLYPTRNEFPSDFSSLVTINFIFSKEDGYGEPCSASGTCIVNPSAPQTSSYTRTDIYGLDGNIIPCCMQEKGTSIISPSNPSIKCEGTIYFSNDSGIYVISPSNPSITCEGNIDFSIESGTYVISPGNSYSECEGNTVTFSADKVTWPKYEVLVSGVTAKDVYTITDCEGSTTVEEKVLRNRMSFDVTDGPSVVDIISKTTKKIILRVKPGAKFTIKVTISPPTGAEGASETTAITEIDTANKHSQCTS